MELIHRVYRYSNGKIRIEEWTQNNKYHRLNGPAIIYYNENGNKRCERWYQNGEFHRLDGPAKIEYYNNGNISSEEWYQNNQQHRLDGPAIIYYNGDSVTVYIDYRYCIKRYLLKDKELTEEQFERIYVKHISIELACWFDDANLIPIVTGYTH